MIALGVLSVCVAGPSRMTGQAIPPTPPTALLPAGAAPEQTLTAAQAPKPVQRAKVTFASGVLSVAADNSSLNQILREIARLTGMKITGGVTEERVYGSYGPDDPSSVLSALLKGTGSNMFLIFDAQHAPSELVLTPRGGGPTPPSPGASRGDDRDEEDLPPQLRPHAPRPGPPEGQAPAPAPVAAPAVVTTQPAPASAPDTTQTVSPNGVSTPQQIYEQLMANQQKKQQQQTPPTTPP